MKVCGWTFPWNPSFAWGGWYLLHGYTVEVIAWGPLSSKMSTFPCWFAFVRKSRSDADADISISGVKSSGCENLEGWQPSLLTIITGSVGEWDMLAISTVEITIYCVNYLESVSKGRRKKRLTDWVRMVCSCPRITLKLILQLPGTATKLFCKRHSHYMPLMCTVCLWTVSFFSESPNSVSFTDIYFSAWKETNHCYQLYPQIIAIKCSGCLFGLLRELPGSLTSNSSVSVCSLRCFKSFWVSSLGSFTPKPFLFLWLGHFPWPWTRLRVRMGQKHCFYFFLMCPYDIWLAQTLNLCN